MAQVVPKWGKVINMAKSKARKVVTKAVNLKASRRPVKAVSISTPIPTPKVDRKAERKPSSGVPQHNGNGNGNGNGHANGNGKAPLTAAAGGGIDTRLEAGTIKTKSGGDLTEKVRE